ncbi:hypothetical protein [Streptomyces sp. NBC_01803]|uniref:hypothetical protein n=1 Tax=Streptomyces sp. NBC_01803 TaxID=2975946 RepID=UPI002DDB2484|nr:hypothetical protein [Streptomyces sp. NBC_01803]WSA42733.1 hypothetical protein OIE51_00010 [Streptomyces sp. NBC_01803]WSA47457.1 hypothetical protein OIE51_26785 [Streptomyces sp. NBC_01803]
MLIAMAPLTLTMAACGDEGSGEREPTTGIAQSNEATVSGSPSPGASVNPEDFVDRVDNPYLPLKPGARWRYEGTTDQGKEVTVVEVTDREKEILGVHITVVRDTVSLDGEVIEDTFDWFAQDRAGNVWYFGEDTKEFKNGKVVSTEGAWEAGKKGAKPGIIMLADPEEGARYQQEDAPDVAEDRAEVISLNETVDVPTGAYDHVLETRETTPLEPDTEEHKFYSRGVGVVLEQQTKGGSERHELVSVEGL